MIYVSIVPIFIVVQVRSMMKVLLLRVGLVACPGLLISIRLCASIRASRPTAFLLSLQSRFQSRL